VVSATDPHGRILIFLDRSSYFFFQVAPQLYSQGSVDSVTARAHSVNVFFPISSVLKEFC
jgi:hypothetical protein